MPLNKSEYIEEGQHIVEYENLPRKIKTPIKYLGHISSSYHSSNLNHCISMAMIKGGNKLKERNYMYQQQKVPKMFPLK